MDEGPRKVLYGHKRYKEGLLVPRRAERNEAPSPEQLLKQEERRLTNRNLSRGKL